MTGSVYHRQNLGQRTVNRQHIEDYRKCLCEFGLLRNGSGKRWKTYNPNLQWIPIVNVKKYLKRSSSANPGMPTAPKDREFVVGSVGPFCALLIRSLVASTVQF